MSTPDEPQQMPLAEWCSMFCPTLPVRIESVVAEWDLRPGDKERVRDKLLEHVRQSVSTS